MSDTVSQNVRDTGDNSVMKDNVDVHHQNNVDVHYQFNGDDTLSNSFDKTLHFHDKPSNYEDNGINGKYYYNDNSNYSYYNANGSSLPNIPVGGDLHTTLVDTLEYILKRENLNGELASAALKFEDEVAIPIDAIALQRHVKALNATEEQIIKALAATKFVYNESKKLVKTGVKIERKTVILSNVPQVSEEEIRNFFVDPSKITNVQQVVESNWFVSFESEDSAIDAVTSSKGKLLGGVKINVAMKSEHLVKQTAPSNVSHVSYFKPPYQQQSWPNRFYPRYQENGTYDRQSGRGGSRYQGGNNNRGRKPRHGQGRGPKESGSNNLQVMANGAVIFSKKPNQGYPKSGPSPKKGYTGKKGEKKPSLSSLDIEQFPPLGSTATTTVNPTVDNVVETPQVENVPQENKWVGGKNEQGSSTSGQSNFNLGNHRQSSTTEANTEPLIEAQTESASASSKAWADIAKSN